MGFWKYIGTTAQAFPEHSIVANPGEVYSFGSEGPPAAPTPNNQDRAPAIPLASASWVTDPGPATGNGLSDDASFLPATYARARTLFPNGTDDTTQLTAAFTASASDGLPIVLAPGRFKVTGSTGLTWDPTNFSITGSRGVIVDCTAMTSGTALSVVSSTVSGQAFKQITNELSGISFEGPTADATTVDGINTTGGAFSNPVIGLSNLKMSGFRDQLVIGDQTWCLVGRRLALGGALRRIINYTGNSTSGENLSFYGCTFHDSHNIAVTATALYVPTSSADATFNFFGCSFDYNDLEMDVAQGHINLHGCYLEDQNTGPMVKLSSSGAGTVFTMNGGRVFIRTAAPSRTSIVDHSSGTQTVVSFLGTRFTTYPDRDYKIVNTIAGSPQVRVYGCGGIIKSDSGATSLVQVTPGQSANVLYNGDFEQNSVAGWSVTGAVGTPTVQSTTKNSGTYALQFVGTGAAGQRVYTQKVTCRPGESVVTSSAIRIDTGTTGSITIYLRAYAQDNTQVLNGSDSYTFSGDTASLFKTIKRYWQIPPGAATVEYHLTLDTVNGTVYVDDCYMAIV